MHRPFKQQIVNISTAFVMTAFVAACPARAAGDPDEDRDASVVQDVLVGTTESAVSSVGLLRISRTYAQAGDGRIVIEADKLTRFVCQDEKNPIRTFRGEDAKASGGRYVSFLKRGWYEIDVRKPGKFVLWYRAYFPSIGNWNHSEQLDDGVLKQVVDSNATLANDPGLNCWVWRKGAAYEFAAGKHTFTLDWQGGAKLDQLAFLPEGVEPGAADTLTPTFVTPERTGVATCTEVTLLPGQTAKRFRFEVEPTGGRVQARVSDDDGRTWQPVPEDGALAVKGTHLLFQLILSASSSLASPTVHSLGLEVSQPTAAVRLDSKARAMMWQEKSVQLIPANWTGVRPGDSNWSLVAASQPDEGGTIWLDAARADQLILAPKQESWVVEDQSAASGRAVYQGVLNRNLLSFDVHVPRTGMYVPWFRVKLFRQTFFKTEELGAKTPYLPIITYQFDRQNLVNLDCATVNDFPLKRFQQQEWVWIPGTAAPVKEGDHTFRLRAGLDYTLLDRIALVPRGSKSPDDRGGQSVKITAATGEIIFQPLDWLNSKQVALPSFDGDLNGGTISHMFSFDGGATWSDSVSGVRAKRQPLLLKAIVKPGPDGRSPRINAWQLDVTGNESQAIALANAAQKILFDGESGMLIGWWSKDAGWIIPAGQRQALFAFSLGAGSDEMSRRIPKPGDLVSQTVETKKDFTALVQKYQVAGGNVTVSVRIELPAHGLSQWEIQVDNRSSLEIRNVEFPALSGIRLGNDPEKLSTVAVCNSSAADFPAAPFDAALGRPLTSWYPGWYSMGWLSYYGPRGAFTVQVRDQDGVGTLITTEKDPNALAMQCNFNRRIYIGPNERGGGRYELGWHGGDWHRSADYYSAWAHSWMDFSRVNSNWTRDADGWVSGWHFASAAIATRYVTHLVPEMEWLGANYFQHFGGSMDGWWSSCFFPLNNPRYGSLDEFRKAHEQSRQRGVYNTYYMGSRGWTDAYDDSDFIDVTPRRLLPPEVKYPAKGFGARWGAKDQVGNVQPWGYAGVRDMMLCPASTGGQDRLVEGIARNYGELDGADGVYSDEACGYTECYAADHGHDKQHGLWESAKGLQAGYRRTLEIARKRNPDFAIAVEGCPDQLLQYADFGLFVFTAYCDGSPFLYTFPEAKLLRGASNPNGIWCRSRAEYIRFINLFLRYDFIAGPNSRQFYAHRKRIKDWMYQSRFMDDANLTVDKPGVIAKWFNRDDATHSGALVSIQNEGAISNATVRIEWPILKKSRAAFAYLFDEEELVKVDLQHEGEAVIVAIPSAKASSLLIPAKFPDQETIRAFVLWPQTSGEDRLVVALANLSSKDREVTLVYGVPDGVTLRDAPRRVKVPAGQVARLEIPMGGLAALSGRGTVTVRVQDRKHTQEVACIVGPPLDNAGFEVDTAGKGTPDGWRTMGHYWFTHLLQQPEIPFDLNHADGVLDTENPAEGKYSLRLDGAVDLPNYWPSKCNPKLKQNPAYKPPMLPWYFNTAHQILLKPGTRYQVSFKYRQAADDGVLEVRSTPYGEEYNNVASAFPLQRARATAGNRDWREYRFEFTAPADGSRVDLGFVNRSSKPAWVDAVTLKMIASQ